MSIDRKCPYCYNRMYDVPEYFKTGTSLDIYQVDVHLTCPSCHRPFIIRRYINVEYDIVKVEDDD